MYAQLVETGSKRLKTKEEMSPQEREFQEKVDAEIKIEAKNWMPEGYRKLWFARSPSMHTLKSLACCRKVTGLPARPPLSASSN